jgi:hypothetical protein
MSDETGTIFNGYSEEKNLRPMKEIQEKMSDSNI